MCEFESLDPKAIALTMRPPRLYSEGDRETQIINVTQAYCGYISTLLFLQEYILKDYHNAKCSFLSLNGGKIG